MKKFLKASLSLFLAVLMAVQVPLRVFADETAKYITEIRVGYGDEGLQQLKDDEYVILADKKGNYVNTNDGGTGSAVYLGYKLTDKKEDAITDLAVMPMSYSDGAAYSFDLYQQEMENLDKQIDQMLEDFDAAIAEFRTNLAKPSPQNDYALRAYTMLNMYTEDDTGMPVGKLFANGEVNEAGSFVSYETEPNTQAYHNVLMMGNSTAVYAIKMALAVGCTETEDTTFLDRLENAETPDEVPATMNSSIMIIADCMESFQEQLGLAKRAHDNADAYEGGRAAYLAAIGEQDPDEFSTVVSQISLIDTMESIPYGDVTDEDGNAYSFYDVMTFSTDASSTSETKLDAKLLSLLVSVMTPGQIAIAQYVDLSLLINNAASTKLEKENGHFALGATDANLEALQQTETVSVYLGVDRTIFSDGDYKTVAITDAAIREGINNENFGVTAEYNESSSNAAKIAMGVSSAACAAAAVGCISYAAKMWGQTEKITRWIDHIPGDYMYMFVEKATGCSHPVLYDPAEYAKAIANPDLRFDHLMTFSDPMDVPVTERHFVTTTGTKVTAVVGVVFAAAAIALAIVTFVQSIQEPERETVDYTDIPRALIDVKSQTNGQSLYFAYYAARLAGASDDYKNEKDTTKLYGDLNGLNGYEKWLALYYAKDLRLGSPLTPDILIKSEAKIGTLQVNAGYAPIHDFFNNTLVANNTGYTATDLNSLSTNKGASKIYIYFKRDLDIKPLAATILDDTSSFDWLALIGFFGGAALATGTTVLLFKRKKKGMAEA